MPFGPIPVVLSIHALCTSHMAYVHLVSFLLLDGLGATLFHLSEECCAMVSRSSRHRSFWRFHISTLDLGKRDAAPHCKHSICGTCAPSSLDGEDSKRCTTSRSRFSRFVLSRSRSGETMIRVHDSRFPSTACGTVRTQTRHLAPKYLASSSTCLGIT
jgi:hypothetical protein